MSFLNNSTLQKGILFLISFFIALVLVEVTLGIVCTKKNISPVKKDGWAIVPEQSWIKYHPRLGWWHQKNKKSFLVRDNQLVSVSTNSIGLRGPREYSKIKPKDVDRIYVLGDSFVFGFGVLDNETFPVVLEELNPSAEVFNMGVAGYGIDQMYLLLKEFPEYESPDIVIIALYPEDFWRAIRAFSDAGYGKPYFVLNEENKLVLKHVPVPEGKQFTVNQFPKIIEKNNSLEFLERSRLVQLIHRAKIKLFKILKLEDPDSREEWILGREILKKMIVFIENNNARPVLMIVPPERWITGTDEPIRESLGRFAKRENVGIIDLTELLRKKVSKSNVYDYYIKGDKHWTAKAHRLVAEEILRYLEARRDGLS